MRARHSLRAREYYARTWLETDNQRRSFFHYWMDTLKLCSYSCVQKIRGEKFAYKTQSDAKPTSLEIRQTQSISAIFIATSCVPRRPISHACGRQNVQKVSEGKEFKAWAIKRIIKIDIARHWAVIWLRTREIAVCFWGEIAEWGKGGGDKEWRH